MAHAILPVARITFMTEELWKRIPIIKIFIAVMSI